MSRDMDTIPTTHRYYGFDEDEMKELFKEFISDLSHRLADEPDYEELVPKFQELMNMVGWVVPEAWECRLGEAFVKNDDMVLTRRK
tara:strand:- start:255 stop:512 length:258 start_codon:yes stop_codon:yes gene_type:complete